MTKYGIELYDEKGNKTLSVYDIVPRFLGSFTVPETVGEGTRTHTFPIPKEHQGLGELFYWYDPHWVPNIYGDVYGYISVLADIDISINVYHDKITVRISINYIRTKRYKLSPFKLYYGVR